MAILVGVVLALFVSLGARIVGLDRDRAFYPSVLAVVASYYGLFAVMGGSTQALLVESGVILAFLIAVVLGFKRSLWIVVVALIAHGLFDLVHGHFIDNPGVPAWWPWFCMAYDVTAGGWLAWMLLWKRESECNFASDAHIGSKGTSQVFWRSLCCAHSTSTRGR